MRLLSEHAPLLEYRPTEVNHNICNIGAPTFSINSQNAVFQLCAKKRDNTVSTKYSVIQWSLFNIIS